MTHHERLKRAQQALERNTPLAAKGAHRQKYHFMPPSGWMNDPNGCIWFGGQYHLFYQHNPYSAIWGAMHWGHATSADLVHWRYMPIALAPSEPYDDHPEGGVFSGSTVDDGGELKAFYTATTNHGQGFVQTQCLATSPDGGASFVKYGGNPVINHAPAGTSPDFRDPKVFRHGDHWHMVLGASLGAGAWHGGEGCAHMYRSADLIDWEYRGILARSGGAFGTMWECPDFFPLGGKWVLTFSPMFHGVHRSMYMVGDMDFEQTVFTPLSCGDLDHGAEYYALQSLVDGNGRVNHLAWQNGWDWMEGWQDFGPTAAEGWCGCAAIPRVLELDEKNRIVQAPVPELASLRGAHTESGPFAAGEDAVEISMPHPACYELELVLDLDKTTAEQLYIDLRADETYRTRLCIDLAQKRLAFDRGQSDGRSAGRFTCALALCGAKWSISIFSDVSSIELFCDNGLATMSNTIYPTHKNQGTFISAKGGSAAVQSCNVWAMDSIW